MTILSYMFFIRDFDLHITLIVVDRLSVIIDDYKQL